MSSSERVGVGGVFFFCHVIDSGALTPPRGPEGAVLQLNKNKHLKHVSFIFEVNFSVLFHPPVGDLNTMVRLGSAR